MQEPSAEELSSSTIRELDKQLDALQKKAVQRLIDQVCMNMKTCALPESLLADSLMADPPMALTLSAKAPQHVLASPSLQAVVLACRDSEMTR